MQVWAGNATGVFYWQTNNNKKPNIFWGVLGRDEWKLFAEKLGLNPAEILYLDKRVLNPCDAALAHSRNQGYVTSVGDLYDALVECDLPIIADLL